MATATHAEPHATSQCSSTSALRSSELSLANSSIVAPYLVVSSIVAPYLTSCLGRLKLGPSFGRGCNAALCLQVGDGLDLNASQIKPCGGVLRPEGCSPAGQLVPALHEEEGPVELQRPHHTV